MSLINEALKKAQRQRTEILPAATSVPSTTGATSPRVAKRSAPMPARTLVLLLTGAIALLVMAGVLTFLVFKDPSPSPFTPAAKPLTLAHVTGSPGALPPIATTPATAVVATVRLTPTPAPDTPVPVPVFAMPEAPQPAKPVVKLPTVPTPNPKVHEFLETLRIAGIRTSTTDPKVIMNDRVFRLNDLVDRNTGLRLTRVNNDTLIFTDANGFEYQKSF